MICKTDCSGEKDASSGEMFWNLPFIMIKYHVISRN